MNYEVHTMNGLFDAEYFDLHSAQVGSNFRIFVGKPSSLAQKDRFPAIFALDGNVSFASLLGTQRMLTQGGEVPASFVIAVGYPGESLWEAMAHRNRDYPPTEPREAELRALGGQAQAGGPAFFRFIQEELKPLIQERYPIDEKDYTLQGVSLGGLFATWVLLNAPEAFHRYILSSPAIWWRDEQVWEWEEAYAHKHKDLAATVFVGAGSLEVKEHLRKDALIMAEKNPHLRSHIEGMIEWSDEHGWPEIAKLTEPFTQRLQARCYPQLSIHCHNMPDENHMSAAPAITSRGLRYVFGSWKPQMKR